MGLWVAKTEKKVYDFVSEYASSKLCFNTASFLFFFVFPQEWQNSIQKNAGLAFIELVNEGR